MRPAITIRDRSYGGGELFIIAGPCVLENRALTLAIAGALRDLAHERGIGLIFIARSLASRLEPLWNQVILEVTGGRTGE